MGELFVRPCQADHGIPCVGYSVEVKRQPKFDPQRAKEAGIPLPYWRRLQNGETVTEADGTVYEPSMVLGQARKGLKLTYCTDSRPKDSIVRAAQSADLFICEGMYGEPDKQEKAKEHKHMSYQEAAQMAKEAGVSELWLTHFSPSMNYPEDFIGPVRAIFPNAYAAKDGRSVELRFEEE